MNLWKKLSIVLVLIFISGCSEFMMIWSLNPFYLEKDIAFDTKIEGTWKAYPLRIKSGSESQLKWEASDTLSNWMISRQISRESVVTRQGKDSSFFKTQNYYIVKLAEANPDSARYQFKLVLFKIKGVLFADFSPFENIAVKQSRMTRENYVAGHTLARVQLAHGQVHLSWLGADYMKDMIQEKRVRIKYTYLNGIGRLILTATSEQLTAMIERYAFEKRFIDWDDQPAMLRLERLK